MPPAAATSKPTLANPPSAVSFKDLKFLITDAVCELCTDFAGYHRVVAQPTDANLPAYLAEFQSHNVTDVVRACEGCYAIERLTAAGIEVVELPFEDGSPPPDHVIDAWLDLVNARFTRKERNADGAGTIAVHCVAGLGRAPVLVAIALIERGAEPLEAVELIRSKRRGAINQKQLAYLEHGYKRRSGGCCVLM